MAQNQVYLIKSGENSFVEETQAIVGISGGKVGIGTTHPEADLHVSGDAQVDGNLTVKGNLTTVDATTIQVDDKNIELGVGSTTDAAADGGGITLHGATNKTFNWVDATDAWTSSENLYLLDGKHFAGDELRALDAGGLSLFDNNQSGITIKGGKVGVHQTAPVYDLDVDGSGNFTSLYVGGNSVLTGEGSVFGKWEDAATEGEIFYTGGNVGVGTINPEHKFHVVGSGVIDGDFVVNGNKSTVAIFNVGEFDVSGSNITLNSAGGDLDSNRGGLIVNGDNGTGKLEYLDSSQTWQSNQGIQIVADKHLQTDKVRAIDAGGLYLQDDGGNGIFIEDGGQVGVNTSSPNYSLDVNGSAKIGSDFYAGSAFKISAGGAVGDIAPASDGDIIKWDDSSNKWVAGANVGGGGGGGVGEVPLATIDSLPSGQSIHQIDFAETYNVEPRIATQLEIDGEGSIIPYVVSGVSTSGYHLIFAQDIPNNNYRIHTTFGGRDVHWETGAGASLYYNDGDVSIQRNFTIGGNLTVNGTQTIVNTETLEIEDHNIVIASNTGYNQLTAEYPSVGDAYAGILWGTGDAGEASPVSLTYQSNKGFAFEGGNVGIGTTTPSSFHGAANNLVVGSGVGSEGLTIYSANNSYGSLYFADGTTGPEQYAGWVDYNHNTNFMRIATNGSEAVRIDEDGNVDLYQGKNLTWRYAAGSTIRGSMSIDSADNITFSNGSSNTERMLIDTSGNVGIGTTNPGAKLDIEVQEGDLLKSKVLNLLTAKGRITQGTTTLYVNQNLTSVFAAGDTIKIEKGIYTITSLGSGAIELSSGYLGETHTANTADLYNVNDALCIDSSGNVGIGTTSPASGAKLDVNGRINTGSLLIMADSSIGLGIQNTDNTNAAYIKNIGNSNVTLLSIDEKIYVKENGNVGIGTTNPSDELHINSASSNVNLRLTRDTDTGGRISCSDGADTPAIIFETIDSGNLSEKMRIDSAGNVGIGTSRPVGKLHVATSNTLISGTVSTVSGDILNASGSSFLTHLSVGDSLLIEGKTTYTVVAINSATQVQLSSNITADGGEKLYRTNNKNLFYISEKTGNVGIGTTNPDHKLHLADGGVSCTSIQRTVSITTQSRGAVQSLNSDGNVMGGMAFFGDGDNNSGALGFYVTEDNAIGNNIFALRQAMRIDSEGNVGIGTTSPNADLEIFSAAKPIIKLNGTGSNALNTNFGEIQFYNRDGSGDGPNVAASIHAQSHSSTGAGGSLVFSTEDANSGVEGQSAEPRMTILSNGNVGIGTTNPAANHKLHIKNTETANFRLERNKAGHTNAQNGYLQITAAESSNLIYSKDLDGNDKDFVIDGGNVGIGTTNPGSYKLNVNGTATTFQSAQKLLLMIALNTTNSQSSERSKHSLKSHPRSTSKPPKCMMQITTFELDDCRQSS